MNSGRWAGPDRFQRTPARFSIFEGRHPYVIDTQRSDQAHLALTTIQTDPLHLYVQSRQSPMDAPGGTTPDGGAMWLENVPRASSNVASSSRRRSSVPLPHHRPRTALQDPSLAAPSLSASASSTSTRYVSQPSRGVSAYPPSPGPVSPTLASTSAFAHDPLSAPLPAPVPIPIAIEGRGSTRGPEGVLSPPTPVPSPRTERRRDQSDGGERPRTLSGMDASRADELRQLMGDDRAEGDMSALGEGLSKMWSDRRAGTSSS